MRRRTHGSGRNRLDKGCAGSAMASNLLGSACDVLGIKDNRWTDRFEPLEVVVAPIDDRDPVEADSLLPRHGAVAVS